MFIDAALMLMSDIVDFCSNSARYPTLIYSPV